MSILDNIRGHDDLIKLNEEQRRQLCCEIRDFLVDSISKTGGHLASNLGVVELTVALETVFDTQKDRLVFDVGHQSYIHKLLTGRQTDFRTLRQFGGLAGFPKPNESASDAFVAGHASSSVSVALGMARARTLMGEHYQVISLLGDGAATGGMVYEGLNDAAVSNEPMIVILNDNAMSIDRNVGGMAFHLSKLRTKEKYLGMKQTYKNVLSKIPAGQFVFRFTRDIKDRLRRMLIPGTIFESMGFTYLGPVDGHDVENLILLLQIAKDMNRPVLLHIMTQKGKGYEPAAKNPSDFHGIGKFNPSTGEVFSDRKETFSDVFGKTMVKLAEKNRRLCAITAAMPGGTGLLEFKKQYPKRLFDVGIAEEHAVSMAGGLAKQGMIPVVAIYSTFLQRAYDMILQDVSMQGLHVVFAVDRAGLVGEDGETHHGVFDVGFLRHAPGLTVLSPASTLELSQMLRWAIEEQTGPVAIRYPRGGNRDYVASAWGNILQNGSVVCHRKGTDVIILTYGTMLQNVMDAAELLQQKNISATVLRLMTLSPLPVESLLSQIPDNSHIVIVEESEAVCGICNELALKLHSLRKDLRIRTCNLGYQYVTHGNLTDLYNHCRLNGEGIANYIQEVHTVENKEEAGCASC